MPISFTALRQKIVTIFRGIAMLCTLLLIGGGLRAQNIGTSTLPEVGPLSQLGSPFIFSGTTTFEGQTSNTQGVGSQVDPDYWRWNLVPTITLYGVPFSANLLLSSEQSQVRQNIDGVGLYLNPQYFQDILRQEVNNKIDELQNSDGVKKIESIKDQYGTQGLSDSVRSLAPDAVNDLDSFQVLQKLQDIRSSSISQHLDDIKSMGLMNSTESFFSNFPTLAIGVTYPNFTPFTLTGLPVTGANVEWAPGGFYLNVAGGQTQKAIFYDTLAVAYQNSLFAASIGYGKRNESHFHINLLYAKDNGASAPIADTALADSILLFQPGPRSNYVIGGDLLLIPDPHFTLAAEISGSMLTADTRSSAITNNDIPSWVTSLVSPTVSSYVDYAYNAQATVTLPETNSKLSASVRRVGPGYYSLGVPNLLNDDMRVEAKLDQAFDKRQITVSGFFRTEHDNLIPWKEATTTIQSYGITLGLNLHKLPYLRLSYTPYTQSSVLSDSALLASPEADTLETMNITRLFSALAGYNLVLGRTVVSTNLSYTLQETETKFGVGNYSSNSYNLNEIINLAIPVSFSVGLGLIQPHATPDTVGAITTVDLSGTFTAYDVWTNTLGFNIASQQNVDNKVGFFINTSFPIWKIGNLTLRAEKNVYVAQSQSVIIGPPTIAGSGNYNEFIFRATLTKSW